MTKIISLEVQFCTFNTVPEQLRHIIYQHIVTSTMPKQTLCGSNLWVCILHVHTPIQFIFFSVTLWVANFFFFFHVSFSHFVKYTINTACLCSPSNNLNSCSKSKKFEHFWPKLYINFSSLWYEICNRIITVQRDMLYHQRW